MILALILIIGASQGSLQPVLLNVNRCRKDSPPAILVVQNARLANVQITSVMPSSPSWLYSWIGCQDINRLSAALPELRLPVLLLYEPYIHHEHHTPTTSPAKEGTTTAGIATATDTGELCRHFPRPILDIRRRRRLSPFPYQQQQHHHHHQHHQQSHPNRAANHR